MAKGLAGIAIDLGTKDLEKVAGKDRRIQVNEPALDRFARDFVLKAAEESPSILPEDITNIVSQVRIGLLKKAPIDLEVTNPGRQGTVTFPTAETMALEAFGNKSIEAIERVLNMNGLGLR